MSVHRKILFSCVCLLFGFSYVCAEVTDSSNHNILETYAALKRKAQGENEVKFTQEQTLAMCYRARAWNKLNINELWRLKQLIAKPKWDNYERKSVMFMFYEYMGPVLSYLFREVSSPPHVEYLALVEKNNLSQQECPLAMSYLKYHNLDDEYSTKQELQKFMSNPYDCQSKNIKLSMTETRLCRCMVLDLNCDLLSPEVIALK